MMQSVLNLLGTKPTDDWGRATLNRRGVLTCASAMRKRSLLSGRPSYICIYIARHYATTPNSI